ncbi:predicted protein [Streptomyces sp. SPB78]|nr:predicted protein [Streptomyces sp. SPB78]
MADDGGTGAGRRGGYVASGAGYVASGYATCGAAWGRTTRRGARGGVARRDVAPYDAT